MNYPEFAKIKDKLFKINTDFKIAIKCNEVAEDKTISDYERSLAIIYLIYGDEGLNSPENYEELLDKAQKFLLCGKEKEIRENNEEPDMDYVEDMDYIEASFMSDYHIDLSKSKMHWWKFNKLINGLSNSEFGNCCVLNRVRNIRNMDLNDIKDKKEREKIIKAKKSVALKRNQKKATKEQQESANKLLKDLGLI